MADQTVSQREIALGAGVVRVIPLGPITLHAWSTGDAMNDQAFLLETGSGLVAIEQPPFRADVVLWRAYAQGLSKPVTDVLISSHPAGGRCFEGAKAHATAAAARAIAEGATGALAANLGKAFGEPFDPAIVGIDAILEPGACVIGGIEFVILAAGDGFDIFIPAAGLAYTHMLGADCHSILANQGHMDFFTAQLEALKATGCAMVLSGHHDMEAPTAIDAKLAYVARARELASSCAGAASFKAAMREAFPGYAGENYLEMSAGLIYAA